MENIHETQISNIGSINKHLKTLKFQKEKLTTKMSPRNLETCSKRKINIDIE